MTTFLRIPEHHQPDPQGYQNDFNYNAHDLLKGEKQVGIVLDGERYVLRLTRAGKLLLTK